MRLIVFNQLAGEGTLEGYEGFTASPTATDSADATAAATAATDSGAAAADAASHSHVSS